MTLIYKYLYKKFGINGIVLYPFIILSKEELKNDKVLMNHEKIHLVQAKEMLVLPFYLFYLSELALKRFKSKSWKEAYCNVSFEKEAYANDTNLSYLEKRKIWNFLSYF